MALINLKQDIFTVDSPLVLTDEQLLTINKATSSVSGYLDYNDFNTFNNKQDAISATLPISITNNNIEIEIANTSTTGALSYTDWNTFNNKQNALNFSSPLSKTYNTISISKANGSTDGYLSSTDWTTFNNKYNSATTGINMFHTTDTTTIRPTGYEYSYIGTSSYPFTNGHISELSVRKINGSSSTPNTGSLLINGRLYIYNGSTEVLQFGFSQAIPSTTGSYNLGSNDNYFNGIFASQFIQRPSDIREKENIENYKNSVLDKLDKLNPIAYTIKGSNDKSIKLGLSAQELKEIEPLCVIGGEKKSDENLGIDLYATLAFAMQAIKELNAKVEDLEARVNELEKGK